MLLEHTDYIKKNNIIALEKAVEANVCKKEESDKMLM